MNWLPYVRSHLLRVPSMFNIATVGMNLGNTFKSYTNHSKPPVLGLSHLPLTWVFILLMLWCSMQDWLSEIYSLPPAWADAKPLHAWVPFSLPMLGSLLCVYLFQVYLSFNTHSSLTHREMTMYETTFTFSGLVDILLTLPGLKLISWVTIFLGGGGQQGRFVFCHAWFPNYLGPHLI